MTDEQLYEAGDVAALVARYREPLVKYAAHRVADQQLAERIADDALRYIAEHRQEWRPGGFFRPRMYAIADRLCTPHDSPATRAEQESADAAFAVLDYLEANAPDDYERLLKDVCDRAESWPHPWPEAELMALAKRLVQS